VRLRKDQPVQPGRKALPSRAARMRWLLTYVIAVDVAAVALALVTRHGLPQGGWGIFILFVAVATLTESWAVTMPGHGSFSFCFAANFTAAVVFGPCLGVLVAGTATLLAEGFIWRTGLMKTVFNTGQLALTSGVAGLVFHALQVGTGFSLTTNAPAYIAAALAYLLFNSALAASAIGIQEGGFLRCWRSALSQTGVFYLAMAPLGILMASAYARSPWALLYFPLLLWAIHQGFDHYMRLRTETDKALVVLADTIDRRDPYTYQHSVRVAEHARRIATRLGLPSEVVELIHTAAQVHDLGKIAIDNRILLKEGPLTPEERAQIQTHSAAGAELAGQFSMYDEGAAIIRHHHERWDGAGYPDKLSGEAIPLGARIIAVADVYDAMTSDRPYRRALPRDIALRELAAGRGTQFEPAVVDAFLALDSETVSAAAPSEQPVFVSS
jgi:putative nucleotidyltransferase with HDIG domain